MASIKKLENGRWLVRYRDTAGKSRERRFDLKNQATEFIGRTTVSKAEGTWIDPRAGDMRLSVWAEQFLALAGNRSANTQAIYRRDIERYILPRFGAYSLKSIPPDQVQIWLNDELNKDGLAASSVHRHYRTLRRMLQAAVEKRRLAFNPLIAVDPPKIPVRDMTCLTFDQVLTLAGNISERYRALIITAVDSGMRWGELRGLQRKRIDLGTRRVQVVDQLIKPQGGSFKRDEPKMGSRRSLKLSAFTTEVLVDHIERFSAPGPDGLVFPNGRMNPLNESSFWNNHWAPARERTGVDCRFHDLRHTSAALAIAAGAHPKAIQTRLGHKTIAITLDLYGHLFPELDEAIADAFGASFIDASARRASELAPSD
jgi:integrase